LPNRRIDITGPFSDSGGITAHTRLPSPSRASTIGDESSMRRPMLDTIRSMIVRTWAVSLNRTLVSITRPCRST
jgi:hypothetical protein